MAFHNAHATDFQAKSCQNINFTHILCMFEWIDGGIGLTDSLKFEYFDFLYLYFDTSDIGSDGSHVIQSLLELGQPAEYALNLLLKMTGSLHRFLQRHLQTQQQYNRYNRRKDYSSWLATQHDN